MDDLISRQMAQRLFGKALTYKEKIGKLTWTTSEVKQWLADCMEQLPPALLGTNLAEVGTDCISRQAAIDALNEVVKDHSITDFDAIASILDLPSAQPEIIRCNDCKHWIPYDWMFSEVWQSKNIADYPEDEIGCNFCDVAMKANDFCSRGERKNDG